ncbi:hypothetical protein BDD12DRAFT_808447 [Trichophaea hybrida]|nr:hypothetical protein BDD12DRAFT_808447 [Trichophaea hybrida]
MPGTFPLYDRFVAADGDTQIAFGGVDLVAAYRYSKKLQEITDNNNNQYGARTHAIQADIVKLNGFIRALTCDDPPVPDVSVGADFRVPPPPQHVRRTAGPPITINSEVFRTGVDPVDTEYFLLADYLGLFLSLLGPAPKAGTRENYCFPLLCVYSKWILELFTPKGIKEPAMVQITWFEEGGQLHDVYLGSSSAGGKGKGMSVSMGEKRFTILEDYRMWDDNLGLNESILFTMNPPPQDQPHQNPTQNSADGPAGKAGTRFGNCAETYPFASTFKQLGVNVLKAQRYHGIAFTPRGVRRVADYSARNLALRSFIRNPCENCTYLILMWAGDPEKFSFHPHEDDPDRPNAQQFPETAEPIP